MKQKTSVVKIGEAPVVMNSEVHFHELLDTEVIIGGVRICTIAGADIREFLEEMNKVIAKYRI